MRYGPAGPGAGQLARTEQLQWVVGVWAVLAAVYFLATWVHRRRDGD